MANELETPDFGNFSIQSTIEGAGNQELLNDLLAPETSTGDPDDIKGIHEPDPAPAAEPQKKKAPAKAAAPASEEEEEEKEDPSKGLSDFLFDEEEDEEEEDTTPKGKEPAPAAEPEGDEDEPDTGTQFTALAKDLFKLGVFTADEDEDENPITTAEEFLERFNNEKKKGASQIVEDFIGQFGEDYQNAFQAIFVKGVDPKEYFGTYNAIENYAEMDLSNEANQIAVIKQGLMDQGFDPEDIETEVERVKNYGDLESVATKFHKVLVKKEASKLQQLEQNREKELRQQAAAKQQYSQNVANILQDKVKAKEFDGIPLNPKLAQELQDFLVADKWKTSSGETLTDFDRTILELKRPENHEMKVKVALLLKILEKDPTLSTIQKAGVTKKTDTLFGEVARQATKTATKSSKTKPTSWWQ
jgi:hypothetical protein